MVHARRKFGNWGEDAAVNYLERQGYEILDRNFNCRWGEIDIIARRQGILAFVEPPQPYLRTAGGSSDSHQTGEAAQIRLSVPEEPPGDTTPIPVRYH